MTLLEFLYIGLGLIVCISLDRVYRLFKDVRDNGINSVIQIEHILTDESIQNIVQIVLKELANKDESK